MTACFLTILNMSITAANPADSADPIQRILFFASILWAAGIFETAYGALWPQSETYEDFCRLFSDGSVQEPEQTLIGGTTASLKILTTR